MLKDGRFKFKVGHFIIKDGEKLYWNPDSDPSNPAPFTEAEFEQWKLDQSQPF
jgi:hypothetical protein